MSPAEHLAKARRLLAGGRHSLAGGFHDDAGRSGYIAAFQAALAYIVWRTGREPKTHRGTHSEFARLAHEHQQFEARFVQFLKTSYELKDMADYSAVDLIDAGKAAEALDLAARLVDVIEAITVSPAP